MLVNHNIFCVKNFQKIVKPTTNDTKFKGKEKKRLVFQGKLKKNL